MKVYNTPGYKAWEWQLGSILIRYTRYALGDNGRYGIAFYMTLKGQP